MLYLAFKAARSALNKDTAASGAIQESTAAPSPSALYRQGLIMHLANSKAVLAWIALVTLRLGVDSSWHDVAIILAGCGILSVVIFCGYALVFSTVPMIRLYRRARRGIDGVLAVFFCFAGLRLLMSRI
nr:LysE family transporter [Citreimonas salinaria]